MKQENEGGPERKIYNKDFNPLVTERYGFERMDWDDFYNMKSNMRLLTRPETNPEGLTKTFSFYGYLHNVPEDLRDIGEKYSEHTFRDIIISRGLNIAITSEAALSPLNVYRNVADYKDRGNYMPNTTYDVYTMDRDVVEEIHLAVKGKMQLGMHPEYAIRWLVSDSVFRTTRSDVEKDMYLINTKDEFKQQ